ncbi:hypothetical protein PMIN06_004766 [Paraphaeosphaeria minitans]
MPKRNKGPMCSQGWETAQNIGRRRHQRTTRISIQEALAWKQDEAQHRAVVAGPRKRGKQNGCLCRVYRGINRKLPTVSMVTLLLRRLGLASNSAWPVCGPAASAARRHGKYSAYRVRLVPTSSGMAGVPRGTWTRSSSCAWKCGVEQHHP